MIEEKIINSKVEILLHYKKEQDLLNMTKK